MSNHPSTMGNYGARHYHRAFQQCRSFGKRLLIERGGLQVGRTRAGVHMDSIDDVNQRIDDLTVQINQCTDLLEKRIDGIDKRISRMYGAYRYILKSWARRLCRPSLSAETTGGGSDLNAPRRQAAMSMQRLFGCVDGNGSRYSGLSGREGFSDSYQGRWRGRIRVSGESRDSRVLFCW